MNRMSDAAFQIVIPGMQIVLIITNWMMQRTYLNVNPKECIMPECPKCGGEVFSAVCPFCKAQVCAVGDARISEPEKNPGKYWASVCLLALPAIITLLANKAKWEFFLGDGFSRMSRMSKYIPSEIEDTREPAIALFIAACIALIGTLYTGVSKKNFRPVAIVILIALFYPIFFSHFYFTLWYGIFMAFSAFVVAIIGYNEEDASVTLITAVSRRIPTTVEDFYAGATIEKGLGDVKLKEENGFSAGAYKEGSNPTFVDLNKKKGN